MVALWHWVYHLKTQKRSGRSSQSCSADASCHGCCRSSTWHTSAPASPRLHFWLATSWAPQVFNEAHGSAEFSIGVAKIPSESMAKDQILKMDLSQKWTKSFLHEQFGTTSASSPTYFLTAKQAALFAVSWGHRCRSSCSLPGMLTSAVNSKTRFTPIELLVGMVLLAFHFWACKPSHSVHLFCWSSQFPHTFRGPNFVVFSTCQRTLRHL